VDARHVGTQERRHADGARNPFAIRLMMTVALKSQSILAPPRPANGNDIDVPSRVLDVSVKGIKLDPRCTEEVVRSIDFPALSPLATEIRLVALLDVNVTEDELAKLRESMHSQVKVFCRSLEKMAVDEPKKQSEWITRAAAQVGPPERLDPRIRSIVYTSGMLTPESAPSFLWESAGDIGIDEPCTSSSAWKRIRPSSPCVDER